jgi:hypothetical protein
MARSIRFLAWSLFAYALHLSTASAQSIDFSFLSCFTQSAPSSSIQLTPSDTQRISIGVGSQYYTEPRCYHQIVQFTVPSNAGTNLPPGFPYYTQHQEFSFDSLVNERIDTSAKCSTYAQQTVLFRKQGAGNWTVLAFTRLTGTWSNNKCRIKVVAGDSDFRDRTYSGRERL